MIEMQVAQTEQSNDKIPKQFGYLNYNEVN